MIPSKRNSWTRGGCCVLAMALQQFLGRGKLWSLVRGGGVVHVVLELEPGVFIDADGAHTEDELQDTWSSTRLPGWREPYLEPFDLERAADNGVKCPDPWPLVQYFLRVANRGTFSPTMRVDYATRSR